MFIRQYIFNNIHNNTYKRFFFSFKFNIEISNFYSNRFIKKTEIELSLNR